jgi:hypothetical protein
MPDRLKHVPHRAEPYRMPSSNTTPSLRAFAVVTTCARDDADPNLKRRAFTCGQQRRISFDCCTA